MIDGARRRAAVLRWRRRALAGAGTVCAAVLATVTAVAGPHLTGAVGPADPASTPSAPASVSASASASAPASGHPRTGGPPYRDWLQVTVDINPRSGLYAMTYGVLGPMQTFEVRSADAQTTAHVVVFDPGTYDGRPLLAGEPVSVGGRAAYYVARLKDADSGPNGGVNGAIGWPDPAGAWVVVYGQPDNRAGLERIAASVRAGPPRDVPAAVQFTYVPAGLAPGYVHARKQDTSSDSVVGFAPFAHQLTVRDLDAPPSRAPLLTVRSLPRSDYLDGHTANLGPPMTIAGHEAWYITQSGTVFSLPPGTALLLLNAGRCQVSFVTSDATRVPLAEVRRMVEGAQFADCADPATWVRPLPG